MSSAKSSPSSGVRGRLDDVRDVLDEIEGPGVEAGVDGSRSGDVKGGGVTETDRCIVAMWIAGRARQKDDVDAAVGCGMAMVNGVATGTASSPVPCVFSSIIAASRAFLRSRSRAFFSFFRCLRAASSSSRRYMGMYGPTPFSRLVRTSRDGRTSKSPARTAVAFRRACLSCLMEGLWTGS